LTLGALFFAGSAIGAVGLDIDAVAIAIGETFLAGEGASTIGADFAIFAEVAAFAAMSAVSL
jgi:hypothetical protein